jgi:hypothetical protein
MSSYPLLQVLLYLSLLLAPPDAKRITIDGPAPTPRVELLLSANGWVQDDSGRVLRITEKAIGAPNREGNWEWTDVAAHVASVKGHDWGASPRLTLADLGGTLEKTDTGMVLHLADGAASARTYTITFHRPPPLAPDDAITVRVMGQVTRPGLYTVSRGSTLADALIAAGGISWVADKSAVKITRGKAGETTSTYNVEKMLREKPPAPMPRLEEGDIIYAMELF